MEIYIMDRLESYNLDLNTLRAITLVRELALKDYHEKRAWLHDRWVKDSESIWKSNKVILSYPDLPPYPSEAELFAAAREVIELMKNPVTDADIKAAEEMMAKREADKEVTPEEVPPEETIVEQPQDNVREILEQLYDERTNKDQSQQT
jgi:hypothetical protein